MTEVAYLTLIIPINGICIDLKNVKAVQKWQMPTYIKNVQAFLGFANFYERFINGYSKFLAPMIAMIGKDKTWS